MSDAERPLTELIATATAADPADRIQWRDPIAAYGAPAIEAVTPWLKDPTMAAFAIRVIVRIGTDGERDLAISTLRTARRRFDTQLRADADWALGALKVVPASGASTVSRTPAARLAPRPASRTRRSSRSHSSDLSAL